MPRVKIDYVVSVSSEDPNHPASNLLCGEVGARRWLCEAGAREAAVLLQLQRAVTISSVHIGSHQAAFVEVLVGTADRPEDQYEVLVPRCVLTGPAESRRAGGAVERVRSFDAGQLAAGARGRRWDRVRLLCSQPYNKHCQFGLSFIHIYEPEAVTPRDTLLSLGKYSSDEDEFRPGALFAQHRQSAVSCNTDAQIRKASARALKNISDPDTQLKKTPIDKSGERERAHLDYDVTPREKSCGGSAANSDDKPCGSDARRAGNARSEAGVRRPGDTRNEAGARRAGDTRNEAGTRRAGDTRSQAGARRAEDTPSETGSRRPGDTRNEAVARRAGDTRSEAGARRAGGAGAAEERAVLRGVVFAMSGFVNPERAELRAAGVALGARYRPDWAADCTHLVCAFPNTPKLKKVVASAPHAYVVSGEWLRACRRTRRREPEEPHALHTPSPAPPPPTAPPAEPGDLGDDTDDEIEKVRAHSKRPRLASPSSHSDTDDVSFVCDERFKGTVTLSDDSGEATEEEEAGGGAEATGRGALPEFLEGLRFVVAGAEDAGSDARLLARYVRAYGGLLLQEDELQEGEEVDYVLCAAGAACAGRGRGLRVRADWLWRCHGLRALAPTGPYELPS